MTQILLFPPAAFAIFLILTIGFSKVLSTLSFKRVGKAANGQGEPYACGQNLDTHMIQPNYTQFFPFAFYFTILHVVALMIALVPKETVETFAMAVTYIFGAIIGLLILYRR